MRRLLILASFGLAGVVSGASGIGLVNPGRSHALAPSLSVDACIEVKAGDTLKVAVSAGGVSDLMAWDIFYAYDPKLLEVVARDVRQFLESETNSNVFDFSDPVPNTSGLYRIGAADTGGPDAGEDGGGVLAIITLRAKEEGLSWSALVRDDRDNDGSYEFGPTLTGTGGLHIGDRDGDGIFDGAVRRGQIAIGRPCREPAPTPYVDPELIPVAGSVNTPGVSPPEDAEPAGGTPATGTSGETRAPDDGEPTEPPSGQEEPSSTREARRGPESRGGGDDNSGGGFSPLLASLFGAGGGAAIIGSYFVLRAVRRPV